MSGTAPTHRQSKVPPHDGRSAEGRFLRRVREDLLQHVGKSPSVTQKALIDRIAWLSLHVAGFDQKALDQGGLSLHDSKAYLSYSNSLTRALRQLGLNRVNATPLTPSEAFAAIHSNRAA